MYIKWSLSNRKSAPKNPPEAADKTPEEAKKGPTPPPDHPWDEDEDGKEKPQWSVERSKVTESRLVGILENLLHMYSCPFSFVPTLMAFSSHVIKTIVLPSAFFILFSVHVSLWKCRSFCYTHTHTYLFHCTSLAMGKPSFYSALLWDLQRSLLQKN